jgi:hypothetical protein
MLLVYPRPMELGPEEVERSLVVLVNFPTQPLYDLVSPRQSLWRATQDLVSLSSSIVLETGEFDLDQNGSHWNEMGSPPIVGGPITNCCSESGQHPVRLKLLKKSEQ